MKPASKTFVTVVTLAAAAGAGYFVWHARPPSPAAAAVADDDALLKRAALERFKNASATLTVGDRRLAVGDPQVEEDMKVRMFKRTLSKEEQMRDPAFRARAENELRMRMPASASIGWDNLSGNQETQFVVKDTRACAALVGGKVTKVPAREVARLGCVEMPLVQNRWDDDATVEIRLTPVEEEDRAWERLVQDTMAEMAATEFVASARGTGTR